jgi:Tfp pilus assembly protein PilN
MLGNMRERIRDPWLIGAVGSTVAAAAVVGALYLTQASRSARVEDELQKAVQDSTRYASVLKEREKAEAKRDTVLRSLNLIRAIDDDRYVWPHVMDEVSRALPPYTWLVSLGFSGLGQAQQPVATMAPTAPSDTTPGKRKRKLLQTVVPRDTVRIRLVGNTVDIQALTRFMKQLESSPFLEAVQLAKSERANDHGKEVTQFQLDMLYSRPAPEYVRRVPLDVTVR